MAYRHNDALHKHQVRAGKLKKIAIVFSAMFFIAVLGVGVDWLLNQIDNTETVVSNETTKSVQAANVSVYRTPYFQFQAVEDWVLVADLSSDDIFTYVKNSGPLVSQRIVFYINLPVEKRVNQNISRLLPVEISSEGDVIPLSSVGEHCDSSWPADLRRNPDRIVHEGVSMECTPSTQEYNVILGLFEGSDRMPIALTNGESATLTVVFSDLTAYPSPGEIYSIVSSLKIL